MDEPAFQEPYTKCDSVCTFPHATTTFVSFPAQSRLPMAAPPAPSGSIPWVMRRLLLSLAASALLLMLLAPAALAVENDGRGAYGATDDKVVTEAGFILIVFFPTFVLLASLL